MTRTHSTAAVLFILGLSWSQEAVAQSQALDTAKIDSHVKAVMASAHIPGVALGIVHENRIIYLKGYGEAGNGGRVTPQTLFYLASVSKPFTSLAVMQLVEAGKIDLDQPLQKYLPEFQLADTDAAARITVRNLLSHVSGLSTLSGRLHYFTQDNSADALAEYVQDFKYVQPTAPVGSKFQYTNSNYTLLARLVEVASGMPYEQYVGEHILTPLGMERTCFSPSQANGLAVGYRYWFGQPVAFSGLPTSRHHLGASGIYSSAEELSRFLIAHLNGGQIEGRSILSTKGVAALHKPAVEIRPKLHYAMGWDQSDTPSGRYVGHGGDWADFHSELVISPEDGWGVVVLMNINGMGGTPEMRQLASAVLDLSRGQTITPPRTIPLLARVLFPMLYLLPVLQVVLGLFFYWRVRCWRRVEEKRPKHWWRVWAWHAVVVMLNLLLAYSLLIALPRAFEIGLRASFVFAPDITWLNVISSGFALAWCVIRTTLLIQEYRQFGRPAVSAT